MPWKQHWEMLYARIDGLIDLGHLYAASGGAQEYHGASNLTLVPQAKAILPLIQQFHDQYKAVLPASAKEVLERFLHNERSARNFEPGNGVSGLQGAIFLVGLLASFRGELAYHLSDREVAVLRRIDRAFVHLIRSIVADSEVRAKWRQAFSVHETRCEALGAAHLLSHGIWAFKAHAQGGRTDLILGGPPSLDEVRRVAEGLVLTEWKRLQDGEAPQEKALAARAQAEQYAERTLAGFEIESRRFLILVSRKLISPLPEAPAAASGACYEVINIPVEPDVPSTVAISATEKP